MRPYSRKNSAQGQYNPHQRSVPQDQMYMGNQLPPQMMYQPMDQYGFQYGIPLPYQNSPILNAPPTPFDSNYGATLLPSHLLMGSPYLTSPKMKYPQQIQAQSQFQSFSFNNSNNHHNHNHNHNYNTYDLNNSNNNNQYSNNSLPQNSNNRKISSLSNKPINARNMRRSSLNEKLDYMKSLFNQPFSITFKILPKGDDAYRTRSLLFENIDKSIDIHSFMSNYVKVNSIESVYIVDHSSDSKSNNVNSNEHNTIDQDKQSILLSFLTRQLCLDFYNSVLQRLKEFKKTLKSESLRLSFVSLNYIPYQPNAEDDDSNNTFLSNLQNDVIPIDSTRSIAVEFDQKLSKEDILNEKLKFLKTNNLRYILESIHFINTKESSKEFNENYIILTFLNIPMANEILNFFILQKQKYDTINCFFVSVSTEKEKSVTSTDSSNTDLSNNGLMKNEFNNSSHLSLQSSESNLSLNDRHDSTTIKEYKLIIDKKDYAEPFMEESGDHLSNITKSQPRQSEKFVGTPMAQEMYINDMGPVPTMSPSFGAIDMFGADQQTNYASSVVSRNGTFIDPTPVLNQSFYLEQPQYRSASIVHPITDSLENQMNASAKIASAMGSDAGNRTIYIGNLNPRSKPEDICNVVRGGILQNIRFIESKHICFVTFIESTAAVQFYANTFIDPIVLHGNTLKLGWGNYSSPLPKSIALAVTIGGSRNVYVSLPDIAFKDKFINSPEFEQYRDKFKLPSPEQLRTDFLTYGAIEQINYLKDSHCCWVNFMNIASAIKLVEEANNKKNILDEKFEGRYAGLIINYGKDRCGNVNRNLVAGKNSRFYNKVKRPSYDIRLSKLEEQRKYKESRRREEGIKNSEINPNSSEIREDGLMNLASLGITLNNDEVEGNNTEVMEKIDEGEEETEPKHIEKNKLLQDFLTGNMDTTKHIPAEEEDNNNDDDQKNSDSSSDIEIIINSPEKKEKRTNISFNDSMMSAEDLTNHAIKTTIMNSITPAISKQALNVEPPFAPDTISRDYAMQFRGMNVNSTDSHNEKWNKDISQDKYNGKNRQHRGNNQRGKSRAKNTRIIPGSDVMAQYLAQLQHSTFMYAANVLGASADDSEPYEE